MPSREELAWCAGFFDGEGCFSGRATLVNTDKSLLERFQQIIGFGKIKARSSTNNPRHKPQWMWISTNFQEQQALIAFIWHWLSDRRREQATQLMDLQKKKGVRPLGKYCRSGRHLLEGDNVYWNIRANREGGKPFRSCRVCRNEYRVMRHATERIIHAA